ncbi:hypothetical protein N8K70_01365 [Microbacterium betulae]|uniref:Uncharacterized protein n=1 Tax=Microbacterium betulae TaxID=2981139 RepID=A0AA97FHX3_9MICO|nr:hypothetical protein [Microbacterium sp. AB]WOF23350.1 hypothetical protein N8K70_01365 [Microbacterium sp. AB]
MPVRSATASSPSTRPARSTKGTPPPRRAAAWLTVWLVAWLVVAGGVMPFVTADWPGWVMPVLTGVLAVSVAGPILVAGWLAGRALRRGAGIVGLLFAVGMLAAGGGQAASLTGVALGGWAVMAFSATALVLLAGVPVWRAEARRREERAARAARRAQRRARAARRGTPLRR